MALFTAQILYVETILITDNTEISVEWPDNDTDVDTIPGGAAGVSPGPDKCIITVSNALRREGADFDFETAKLNRTELECKAQQIGASKSVKGKFLVREITRGGGVGQPSIQSLRLQSVGPVPKLE
jgi:hypothetical protein